jgi:hypothetical protein
MADVVGSYAVSTFTTPAQGAQASSATLRGNFNTLRDAITQHDADPVLHWQSATYAGLPAAGTASKAKYLTTDTRRLYVDLTNGAALSEVAYVPHVSGVGTVDTRLAFGAAATFSAGSVYKDATHGVAIAGSAGATHDVLLWTAGGTGSLAIRAGAAGETNVLVYDVTAAAIKRVSIGAADSGGSGFKVLRIPN